MKIVIVDDDNLVLTSLKMIVESDENIKVVDTGNSGEEAIELYEKYNPDVLLMDIRMKGMTGLEAGENILEHHRDAKILYLTTFNDDEYIQKALTIGAKGYIIKQEFESIVPSLKTVYEGNLVFGSEIGGNLTKILSGDGGNDNGEPPEVTPEFQQLTELELDIVKCVSKGHNNKEIADELCLSEGTVRNYISNILGKLEIRDRTNLAITYINTCANGNKSL